MHDMEHLRAMMAVSSRGQDFRTNSSSASCFLFTCKSDIFYSIPTLQGSLLQMNASRLESCKGAAQETIITMTAPSAC